PPKLPTEQAARTSEARPAASIRASRGRCPVARGAPRSRCVIDGPSKISATAPPALHPGGCARGRNSGVYTKSCPLLKDKAERNLNSRERPAVSEDKAGAAASRYIVGGTSLEAPPLAPGLYVVATPIGNL